jgi:hypothetical protein
MFNMKASTLHKAGCVILALLFMLSTAQAAKMEATLLWKYDVRVSNQNAYIVNLRGDNQKEVIADAPESGIVYAINGDGTLLWKYGVGTLYYDSYATDPDQKGTCLVIGMYRNVYSADQGGQSVWRKSLMSDDARSVYAADINDDGYLEFIVGLFSKMRGKFQILDQNGNLLKEVSLKGMQIPYVINTADINRDGQKEILMGTASFSVNTIAGNYELNQGRGSFNVYSNDGTLLWNTDDAVYSIDAKDIDGDGSPEVILGTPSQVVVYKGNGDKLWSYDAGGIVHSLVAEDVNNDSKIDVVAGAGKNIIMLDSNGKKIWGFKTSTDVMSVDAKDLDGDGTMEVIYGTNLVGVLSDKGEMLWTSDAYQPMTKVAAEDINADTYYEIVSGSTDGWIRVFETAKYAKSKRAADFASLASMEYDQMRYDRAKNYANSALALYQDLSDNTGVKTVQSLLTKTDSRMQADGYYNTSLRLFKKGDYANASAYASKANNLYRSLSTSFDAIAQMNLVIDTYKNMTDARDYYNQSVSFYLQGDYQDASVNALKAVALYVLLNDSQKASLADDISNKSLDHLAADSYFQKGLILKDEGNTTASSECFANASEIYTRLGDVNGTKNVEDITGTRVTAGSSNLKTYGWVVIAAAFALGVLLVFALVTVIIYRSKKDEFGILLGSGQRKPKGGNDGLFKPKGRSSIGA